MNTIKEEGMEVIIGKDHLGIIVGHMGHAAIRVNFVRNQQSDISGLLHSGTAWEVITMVVIDWSGQQ